MRKNYLVYDRCNNEVCLDFFNTFDEALSHIKNDMRDELPGNTISIYIEMLQKQKDNNISIKPDRHMKFYNNIRPVAEVFVKVKDHDYVVGIAECGLVAV